MNGIPSIIEKLNYLLSTELAAINQYTAALQYALNYNYNKLAEAIKERLEDERKHAERIVARIVFLGGVPDMSKLDTVNISPAIDLQIAFDHDAELKAISAYNEAIEQAEELLDDGTRKLLEENLLDEEDHTNYLEAQLSQINQMGFPCFLMAQI